MVTADEARRIRLNKGAVNHETYKEIYGKITNRIKLAAARGDTHLEFTIPPLIPGRPMYDMSHAMRYNHDKLVHNGFRVDAAGDVLQIDWKDSAVRPAPRAPKPQDPPKDPPKSSGFGSTMSINAKLENLKKKLKW